MVVISTLAVVAMVGLTAALVQTVHTIVTENRTRAIVAQRMANVTRR